MTNEKQTQTIQPTVITIEGNEAIAEFLKKRNKMVAKQPTKKKSTNTFFGKVDAMSVENKNYVEEVKDLVESRIDFLNDREPESDGETHDKWSDNVEGLEDILSTLEDILDNLEDLEEDDEDAVEEINDQIDDVRYSLENHQEDFGGLTRWK